MLSTEDAYRTVNQIMADARVIKPRASRKVFNVIGPNATGHYCARVVQVNRTTAGNDEQLLDSRMFKTTGAARRWLNTKL